MATTVPVRVGQDCAVTTWSAEQAPATPPAVTVTGAVQAVVPTPLPVQEVSPPEPVTATLTCGDAAAVCEVRVEETQYRVAAMFGGVGVLLGGAGFVIRNASIGRVT